MAAAGGLAVLIALVRWGGTTRPGPLFVAGVALLTGLMTAFGLLAWWLYGSALPRDGNRVSVRRFEGRRLAAVMVLLSGILFDAGGIWDEIWHRRYGSFGDDFLWPPHMLLYSSIALIALFAGGSLLLVVRGAGGIRERFRSEPLIGLLGLAAAYLLASLPSDQLWHVIYGRDISAWSLPHIMLASGIALIMLVGVALQLSLEPWQPWRDLRGIRAQEVLALALIGCAVTLLLQLGTTEWDGITASELRDDAFSRAFRERPEWLYPVVVVCIALFSGMCALHALRRAGAATLLGLLVLGFRLLSLAVFQAEPAGLGYDSYLLILPPLVALDLWYAARLRHAEAATTSTGGSLLAGLTFLVFALPYISWTFVYPRVDAATAPPMIGIGLVAALAAGWLGMRTGAWLGGIDRYTELEVTVQTYGYRTPTSADESG